jgi:hypothetical protein
LEQFRIDSAGIKGTTIATKILNKLIKNNKWKLAGSEQVDDRRIVESYTN